MSPSPIAKLLSASSWAFVARVTITATTLGISMALARVLGAEQMGLYFLFLRVTRFFTSFMNAGMTNSIFKLAGIAASEEAWGSVRKLMRAALSYFAISAIVVGGAFLLLWPLLHEHLFKASFPLSLGLVFVAVIVLNVMLELGSVFFRGIHETRTGVLLHNIPRNLLLLSVAVGLLFAVGTATFETILTLYLIVTVAAALLVVVLITRFYLRRRGDAETPEVGGLKAFSALSLPLLLHGASSMVFKSSDIWILGFFSAPEVVGVYGVAAHFTRALALILGVVNLILPPMLASLYARGEMAELKTVVKTVATWSTMLAVPVGIVLVAAPADILALTFGDEYVGGARILVILAVAHSISAMFGSPGVLLNMAGHHNVMARLSLVTTVFNVIANLAVVQAYGAEGVAVVTAVTVVGHKLAATYLAYARLEVLTLPSIKTIRPSALALMVSLGRRA